MNELPATEVIAESEVEETDPVGPVLEQPRFLNQMIALRTRLGPQQLLEACHEIEREAGRVRRVRYGPRTLDLDLVWFEGFVQDDPDLTLPHPGLSERPFWRREMEQLDGIVSIDRDDG